MPPEFTIAALAIATYSVTAFAWLGRAPESLRVQVGLRPLLTAVVLRLWLDAHPDANTLATLAALPHALAAWLARRFEGPAAFAFLHGGVAAALWLMFTETGLSVEPEGRVAAAWLAAGAYTAVVPAGGEFVGRLVRPYLAELGRVGDGNGPGLLSARRGLVNAGRTIGQLERFLVLLFLLAGQPTAIGFLVAAKSIFRFGELRDTTNRMESEYIIIGTLASFAYALAIGMLAEAAL